MADQNKDNIEDEKNVFISHVHEDDPLLEDLKKLLLRAGMKLKDSSINSDKPNDAKDPEYIKRDILAPQIQWASTLIALINHGTAQSDWVNWEIEYAIKQGKKVIGVFAHGVVDADIPEGLRKYGDAEIVEWHGEKIIDAINGKKMSWENPETGKDRKPEWSLKRYTCK
jgi:hypothetical protein